MSEHVPKTLGHLYFQHKQTSPELLELLQEVERLLRERGAMADRPTVDELKALRVVDLRQRLSSLGLPQSGNPAICNFPRETFFSPVQVFPPINRSHKSEISKYYVRCMNGVGKIDVTRSFSFICTQVSRRI